MDEKNEADRAGVYHVLGKRTKRQLFDGGLTTCRRGRESVVSRVDHREDHERNPSYEVAFVAHAKVRANREPEQTILSRSPRYPSTIFHVQ